MDTKYAPESILLQKYICKRKLGKGAFGDVFLVQLNGEQLALKVIDKKKMQGDNEYMFAYLQGEIQAMKDMDFKYIVQLKEFAQDKENYYMIIQYCDGGDLMNLQATQSNKVFPLETAAKYLSHVILGLQALHQKGYLHRDIKPQNVLVKNVKGQKIFKIADFGFAKKAKNVEGTVLGTEQFMAPEIYRQGLQQQTTNVENDMGYGFEVDMWAFGVLFFYMLNFSHPFQIKPFWSLESKYKQLCKKAEGFSYRKAVARTRHKIQQNCTEEVEDLFNKIFTINQEKRINFSEIRQHPVFSKFFLKSSQQSKILYNLKFKKQQTKVPYKSSQPSKVKMNISQIIYEEIYKKYLNQPAILNLLVEEICFLPEIVDELQHAQKQIGQRQLLMFSFNLIKYHIVLFKKFIFNLKYQVFQKKYPEFQWKQYFQTQSFNQFKQKCIKKIKQAQIKYGQLYQKCLRQLKYLCKINDSFGNSFDQEIVETDFDGEFFRSYRKSTDIIYSSLKEYLMTNKILKFYYFICMTCICHVFGELQENENLKRKIYLPFLEEVSEKINTKYHIDYKKLIQYLRKSEKQVLLKLAKEIIENVMTIKNQ